MKIKISVAPSLQAKWRSWVNFYWNLSNNYQIYFLKDWYQVKKNFVNWYFIIKPFLRFRLISGCLMSSLIKFRLLVVENCLKLANVIINYTLSHLIKRYMENKVQWILKTSFMIFASCKCSSNWFITSSIILSSFSVN